MKMVNATIEKNITLLVSIFEIIQVGRSSPMSETVIASNTTDSVIKRI